MARTAPVPNIPPIPGMCPSIAVMGGGAGGGGGSGDGAGDGDGSGPGSGNGNGEGAGGDGRGSGSCGNGTGQCPGPHGGSGTAAGDPIDLATGRVFTIPNIDLFIPGPLKFELLRQYNTAGRKRDVGLGYGWTYSYGARIEVGRTELTLWNASNDPSTIPLPAVGSTVEFPGGTRLTRAEDGFRLLGGDGVVTLFSRAHAIGDTFRLSGISDSNGNEIGVVYNGEQLFGFIDVSGRLIRVRMAGARIEAFEVKNALEQGQWVTFYRYQYDDAGDLVGVTDAEGQHTRFSYIEHRLIEEQRPSGMRIQYVYDTSGRCVETWCSMRGQDDPSLDVKVPKLLADGFTKAKGFLHCKIAYLSDGLVECATSAEVRRLSVTPAGKVQKGVVGGAVFSHLYDDLGFETAYVDPTGAATQFLRLADGKLSQRIDALGHATRYHYDAHDRLVRMNLANGGTVEMQYDGRGNMTFASDDYGPIIALKYTSRGQIDSVHFPNGGIATCRYDAFGNRISVTEPDGRTKRLEYDYLGRVVRFIDADGATRRFGYTARNALATIQLPTGGVESYEYDSDRRLSAHIDADGVVERFLWAGNDKVIEYQEADGTTIKMRYDREGRLCRVINELGESYLLERDTRGLVVKETWFDGREQLFRYDAAGRVVLFTNGARERTRFEYDETGQLLLREFADGAKHEFAYDPMGHTVSAKTAQSEVRMDYDLRGRCTREALALGGRTFEVQRTFDVMNHFASRSSSLGYHERVYRDGQSRTVAVELPGGKLLERAYDTAGRERLRTLPGRGELALAHDALGNTTHATVRSIQKTETFERAFHYSNAGQLVDEVDPVSGTVRYVLDQIGQLVAKVRATKSESFSIDPARNLREDGPNAPARSYGAGNRCLQRGDVRYEYDADGRLVSRHTDNEARSNRFRFTWSVRGTLSSVRRPDGRVISFEYDAFNRRVAKTVKEPGRRSGGSRTVYLWDGTKPLHEIRPDAKGTGIERTYVFDDVSHAPLAQWNAPAVETGDASAKATDDVAAGDWWFFVNGPTGEPLAIVDGEGQRRQDFGLSAFGRATGPAAAESPLRFQGQLEDEETGLHYNYYRYYDPELGRYISPDPIGTDGGLNLYAYCANRPHAEIDPAGLARPSTTSIAGGSSGHSQGHHTAAGTSGNYGPGCGALPPNFPQLGGTTTGPNQCGEVEALNNHFAGLDPNNPAHQAEIRQRALAIPQGGITPTRDATGDVIPPCMYCTQRIAHLSAVSGVNLFDRVTPPTNGRTTPYTNVGPANQARITGAMPGSNFPYRVGPPGNSVYPHGSTTPLELTGDRAR